MIAPVVLHDQFLSFAIVSIAVLSLLEFQLDLTKTGYMLVRRIRSGKLRVEDGFLVDSSIIGMPCPLLGRHRRLLLDALVIVLRRRTVLPTRIPKLLGFGILELAKRAVGPAASAGLD